MGADGIEYRTMRESDYDQCMSLWKTDPMMGVSVSDAEPRFRHFLSANAGMSFVAVTQEGEIVGTILCGTDWRRGWINHLIVADAYRHMGIGTRLVTLAEDAMRGMGDSAPSKAYVLVRDGNDIAERFWGRRGYSAVDCDDFHPMRKSLSDAQYATYEELDATGIIRYLSDCGIIDTSTNAYAATETGDGNMNRIWRVAPVGGAHVGTFPDTNTARALHAGSTTSDTGNAASVSTPDDDGNRANGTAGTAATPSGDGGTLIAKQAMPHGKIDVTCYEPTSRAVYEQRYWTRYHAMMPDLLVPRHAADKTMALSAYADCGTMPTLRDAMLAADGMRNGMVGDTETADGILLIEGVGSALGRYCAMELLAGMTVGAGKGMPLTISERDVTERRFRNARMRELTDMYVLDHPFHEANDNTVDAAMEPVIRREIWEDEHVTSAAAMARRRFLEERQCVIHGDFHPGNVFVGTGGRAIVSDYEFACVGPVSYDLGTMLGNLIMSLRVQPLLAAGHAATGRQRRIAAEMDGMLAAFEQTVLANRHDGMDERTALLWIDGIVHDAIMFAGSTMAGRTWGYCRFPEAKIAFVASGDIAEQTRRMLVTDVRTLLTSVDTHRQLIDYIKPRG